MIEIGLIFVLTVDIDNLHQELDRPCDVVGREGIVLHRDADDDVGAHLTGNVCRVVIAHASVDEQFVPHAHR